MSQLIITAVIAKLGSDGIRNISSTIYEKISYVKPIGFKTNINLISVNTYTHSKPPTNNTG